MAVRLWTCRKGCGRWPRTKQKCPTCGSKRPTRPTAAQKALKDPYEVWEARFGSTCNICGAAPSGTRRLDRDHDHKTLEPRGLLCFKCNQGLPNWATPEWLQAAKEYLERPLPPVL